MTTKNDQEIIVSRKYEHKLGIGGEIPARAVSQTIQIKSESSTEGLYAKIQSTKAQENASAYDTLSHMRETCLKSRTHGMWEGKQSKYKAGLQFTLGLSIQENLFNGILAKTDYYAEAKNLKKTA